MNDSSPTPPPPVHRLLGGTGLGLAFLAAGLLLIVGRGPGVDPNAAPLRAVAAVWVAGLGLSAITLIATGSRAALLAGRVFALGVAVPAGLTGALLSAGAQSSAATPLLFVLSVSALGWVGATVVLSRVAGGPTADGGDGAP